MRVSLLTGALLVVFGILLSNCTAVVPKLPSSKLSSTLTQINNLDEAEAAFKAHLIATYGQIWEEENGDEGDKFSAGLSAWKLASITEDSAWSNAAINAFTAALKAQPDMPLLKAWLGSSHALMARDFPIQGWWQIIPGPGFVRLYHVKKSFSYLDEAVGMTPKDPIVRLIRGSTYLGMPSIFGGHKEGNADFELLEQWLENPQRNPEFADLLTAQTWLQEYYFSCARAMANVGRDEEALRCWRKLYQIAIDPNLKELAKWHMT